jgi:hypothetical protein
MSEQSLTKAMVAGYHDEMLKAMFESGQQKVRGGDKDWLSILSLISDELINRGYTMTVEVK